MFAVIFEVQPKRQRFDDYLDLAKALRPAAGASDGFIDVERYASETVEGRLLSLSLWRDEAAVTGWRNHAEHRRIQAKGRTEIFDDYRLRVGPVTEDSEAQAASASSPTPTAKPDAKAVSITEYWLGEARPTAPLADLLGLDENRDGLKARDAFTSLYTPGKRLLLVSWRDRDAAELWRPAPLSPGPRLRHRRVLVLRDYGMRDRAEAPQAAPEAPAAAAAGR